jgi:hypothetical protein
MVTMTSNTTARATSTETSREFLTTLPTIVMNNTDETTIVDNNRQSTSSMTTTTIHNEKSYEFQSNFSRYNDSVFVSLHVNISDAIVSINNTFSDVPRDDAPSQIQFYENSKSSNRTHTLTSILIHLNRTLTRDIANQLGDRLFDISDLLVAIRSMTNHTHTVDIH